MKRYITLSIIGTILLIGIVIAQAGSTNFPPSFQFNLNNLPPAQSPTQKFFNCPYYDGSITLRDVTVYNNPTGLNPNVNAQIRYWIGNGKCSASYTKNFTVAPALTPTQLVTNFNAAVNTAFQLEALSNHQPPSPPPAVSGSSNGNTSPGNNGSVITP